MIIRGSTDLAHVRRHRGDGGGVAGERRAVPRPDRGEIYGRIVMLIVPGADDMQLYQPTHKVAYDL